MFRQFARRREKIEINKIRDKNRDTETKIKKLWEIIRIYFKNLYFSKFENLKNMYEFLYIYNLPKLNQDEIKNLNRLINPNEIKVVIKNLPAK